MDSPPTQEDEGEAGGGGSPVQGGMAADDRSQASLIALNEKVKTLAPAVAPYITPSSTFYCYKQWSLSHLWENK